ncbi:MAG: hypothetical protein MI757_08675, partial [Pirellulales bacterium]|nr:hypothetical protein [Pirellulales bacterium]
WYKSGVKEYPAVVKIHDTPPQLKTGFRAQVRVHALAMDDAQTLPVQAVLQRGRKYFVVLPDGSNWRSHEVTVGPSNEKFVVIESGLSAGDQVAADARALEEEVELPSANTGRGDSNGNSGRGRGQGRGRPAGGGSGR